MNEVKRYHFSAISCDEPSIGEMEERDYGDYVKLSDFQSERAARIAAETKLVELEDENRKLIRYGTFIFNRVNFSIGRAKSKIADKAVLSCMQKITEISKARSKS